MAQMLGETSADSFGRLRVGFFGPDVVGSVLTAHLRHNFHMVGTFTDDRRLESLIRTAVEEFFGDSIAATVSGAGMADRATDVDALGFHPYVEAVGKFLLNADTQPPLTMSVEGSWGSGKSSFMLQLAKYLRDRNALTIDFNAWRYEKAEELWAAFAIQFVRKLKRTRKNWDRFRREIALAYRRFDWSRGGMDLVRVALLLIALAFATVAVPVFVWVAGAGTVTKLMATPTGQTFLKGWMLTLFAGSLGVGASAAWLSAAIPLWRVVTKELRKPLAIDLRKYVRAPDYETKIAFLDRFHEDLDHVIGAFVDEGQKVFVFIDDLDRCEVPHAADLMQAINLMLADRGPLIFIIGMDREKVAAGLAVKHEKLLPYLSRATPNMLLPFGPLTTGPQGLAFGYNFIEKFIQVPFVIPEPTDADIEALLKPRLEGHDTSVADEQSVTTVLSSSQDRPPSSRAYVTLDLGADAPVVIDIAKMVAPALDRNPRRIKQFVNLFRLRAMIADATGLFVATEGTPRSNQLTLQKIGKFVALELRWPLLLADLEEEPGLIGNLQRIALRALETELNLPLPLETRQFGGFEAGSGSQGPLTLPTPGGAAFETQSPVASYWSAQPQLMNLLRSGCVKEGRRDESGIAECGIDRIDILQLLRVSRSTKRTIGEVGEARLVVEAASKEGKQPLA